MSHEDTPTTVPVDASSSSADALTRERDALKDRLLRTTADFDNYRKRTDRERRELSEFVAADVIRDVLPVLDDLERALGTPIDDGQGALQVAAFRDGLALIHRQLVDVLRRRGVEPIEVIGQDFNPEWHEALGSDPLDGRRDGEITAEIRKGYRIGSKLLRPAMVKVAQA
jgi:molecular chaperone GrpE